MMTVRLIAHTPEPEKVVAALMRKGFKYGEIKRALEQFDIQTEDY